MKSPAQLFSSVELRLRLIRKALYRSRKMMAISKLRRLIGDVHYESPEILESITPFIVLSNYSQVDDFLVLSYLFKDKDLTFISPEQLPNYRAIDWLRKSQFGIFFEEGKIGFSFYRKILSALKDYNRSVLISPQAAKVYADKLVVSPSTVAKIAMKTSVPIVPVFLKWPVRGRENGKRNERQTQCEVFVGRKLYVSPRTAEFKDIFFRRRGARKFMKLNADELKEVGNRIFNKIESMDLENGTNLSQAVA